MRDLVLYASCVTRDPLALTEHDFNILYFQARTNLPSLSSLIPVRSIEIDRIRSDHNFHERCYRNDLGKNFKLDFEDKIVVFDFIDDRFPTAFIDKTMFTYNQLLLNENPHIERETLNHMVHQNPANWGFVEERVKAIGENFAKFLKNNKVVIHKAYFDPNYTGKSRSKESIIQINKYFDFLYAKIEQYWDIDYVISLKDKIDSPVDHRWGHAPFHYSDNYAVEFVKELQRIAEDIQRKKFVEEDAAKKNIEKAKKAVKADKAEKVVTNNKQAKAKASKNVKPKANSKKKKK